MPRSVIPQSNDAFLQIWGGLNTIGGNKIFLFSGRNHGIILDFGWNFSISTQYLDEFMKLRSHQILNDALTIGELPRPKNELTGLYREDLYQNAEEELKNNFEIEVSPPLYLRDLFLSHAHADHLGNIQYLHPNIRIHCSSITNALLEHFEQFNISSSMFRNILSYKPLYQISDSSKGPGRTSAQKLVSIPRDVQVLQNGEKITCAEGDFQVTLYDVDHSIPGASAFLIEEIHSRIRLAYTGDFRFHGPQQENSRTFIQQAKKFSPDFLIMEGTRLKNYEEAAEKISENEICTRLTDLFQRITPQKPVFFDCSGRDLWRFYSFFQASIATSRQLVVPGKVYHLFQLALLNHILPFEKEYLAQLKVYLPKKSWGLYEAQDYSQSPENRYILELDPQLVVKAKEIHQNPGHYVMYLPFNSMTEFLDLKPPPNAYYIVSKSEPFDDEMLIEKEKFNNWMQLMQIPEENIVNLHCSGHIRREQMQEVINSVHPKILIPIHTENPEEFTRLGLQSDIKILIPKTGEKILLKNPPKSLLH